MMAENDFSICNGDECDVRPYFLELELDIVKLVDDSIQVLRFMQVYGGVASTRLRRSAWSVLASCRAHTTPK